MSLKKCSAGHRDKSLTHSCESLFCLTMSGRQRLHNQNLNNKTLIQGFKVLSDVWGEITYFRGRATLAQSSFLKSWLEVQFYLLFIQATIKKRYNNS